MTTPSPTSTSSATPSCTSVAPQGPYGYIPPEACNANWSYSPSYAAAVAVAAIFGVLTLAHLSLAILFRKGFCWVIIMGAGWELIAFITRSLGAHHQDVLPYAYLANIFFLLAPLWINAYIYMTAGRLIWTYHPQKKVWFCKAASIGKYFVWLDIISFLIQATGGSFLSPGNSASTMNLGKDIYMAGIGVQEGFILLFLGVVFKFMLDVQKLQRPGTGYFSERWQLVTYSIFASLVFITIRILFRLVEFSAGTGLSNPLPNHEGYAYGLDAVPMILAVGVLAALHSGLALQGPESNFPTRKERKLEKKQRKAEKKARKSLGKGSTDARQEFRRIDDDQSELELNRL